jgi:hypothetical protein
MENKDNPVEITIQAYTAQLQRTFEHYSNPDPNLVLNTNTVTTNNSSNTDGKKPTKISNPEHYNIFSLLKYELDLASLLNQDELTLFDPNIYSTKHFSHPQQQAGLLQLNSTEPTPLKVKHFLNSYDYYNDRSNTKNKDHENQNQSAKTSSQEDDQPPTINRSKSTENKDNIPIDTNIQQQIEQQTDQVDQVQKTQNEDLTQSNKPNNSPTKNEKPTKLQKTLSTQLIETTVSGHQNATITSDPKIEPVEEPKQHQSGTMRTRSRRGMT